MLDKPREMVYDIYMANIVSRDLFLNRAVPVSNACMMFAKTQKRLAGTFLLRGQYEY